MFYEVDTETLNTHQSWISFFFQNVFFKFSQIITPPPPKKKTKKNKKTLSWVNDILTLYPGLYFSILKNQIFLVLWNIFCNDDTVRVWKFSRKSSHLEKSLEKIKGTFSGYIQLILSINDKATASLELWNCSFKSFLPSWPNVLAVAQILFFINISQSVSMIYWWTNINISYVSGLY